MLWLMKVLYISPFDEPVSGADRSLITLIAQLSKIHTCHIVLPPQSAYISRYQSAGAQVHLFDLSRIRKTKSLWYWLQYIGRFMREIAFLNQLLKKEAFDLIHLNMHVCLAPLLMGKMNRLPVIVHYRGNANDQPTWFYDPFLRFLHRFSSHIICISHAVEAIFTRRHLSTKISVLYNPVVEIPASEKITSRASLPKRILYLGRIHARKNIMCLLRAFHTLSRKYGPNEIQLDMVGEAERTAHDQNHKADLQAYAQEHTLNVQWFGHHTHTNPFISAAHVLVLPSYHEGFGRVLVEAMVMRLPVIGSRSGAIPEVLADGKRGALFDPDDPHELAQLLENELFLSPRSVTELEQIALEIDHLCSSTAHAKQVNDIYAQLHTSRHLKGSGDTR